MGLWRGFKTEANWYARSFREELGLAADSALCPRKLAKHLDIPIVPLQAYVEEHPVEMAYLRSTPGQKDFSAVTICDGQRRLIIFNDAHSQKRQASDIVHELSHIILRHPPKPPFDAFGSRHYDDGLEEEANWLGPALLISDEAALTIARSGVSIEHASDIYGATREVVRMRLNVSGAYRRLGRSAA